MRQKSADRAFEDRVWLTFQTLGYTEMNQGYEFTIPTGDSHQAQIDVYARGEDHAIVVECKNSEDGATSSSVLQDLRAFVGIRAELRKNISLRIKSRNEPSVSFSALWVTKGIRWSRKHLDYAKENDIEVMDSSQFMYIEALAKDSSKLAQLQLLSHLLGNQRIPGYDVKVPAIRGKEGRIHFFQFVISPEDLAKISYVQHRASLGSEEPTYQRLLRKSKLNSIAKYLNEGKSFPTPVLVNFHTQSPSNFKFEELAAENQPDGDLKLGMLTLPNRLRSAWIIDGQHRLFGYFHQNVEQRRLAAGKLFVIAYQNLSEEEEARRFIEINTNQTSLPSGLVEELFSELFWGADSIAISQRAVRSRLTNNLATKMDSILYNKVSMESRPGQKAPLTYTGVAEAIRISGLIGRVDGRQGHIPGPLSRDTDQRTVTRVFNVLNEYLTTISELRPLHWNLGSAINRPGEPGGYLCSNRGVTALLLVLNDLIAWVNTKTSVDLLTAEPELLVKTIRPYLQPLLNHFSAPTYDSIAALVAFRGSTAGRDGGRELEELIHGEFEDFNPPGLDEHKARVIERIQGQITAGTQKFVRLVQDVFLGVANAEYGGFMNWYTKAPSDVTERVGAKHGRTDPSAPITNFIDLEDMGSIANHLGKKIKQHLDIVPGDNLAWIQDVNTRIRNPSMHPENRTSGLEELAVLRDYYQLLRSKVSESEYLKSQEINIEVNIPELNS